MRAMRMDRLLSMNGLSRSQAAALIRSGAVRVNGEAVRNPAAAVDLSSEITLNGQRMRTDEHLHVMIYKPAGYLTATEDKKSPVVSELLPELFRKRGVGPVGRLDKDVTGLLLMTTDGQLAHRLISPKWEQDKVYLAKVEGEPSAADEETFRQGVPLKEFTCLPARLRVLERGEVSLCEVVVQEGKYHQVKRMLAAVGHPVVSLHRREVAGIRLDSALSPGQWRELTGEEVSHLYTAVGMKESVER